MKRFMLVWVVAISLFASSGSFAAGASGVGSVAKIGGQVTGQATLYFGILPVPVGRAACNTNNTYQFVFDPATDAGRALYSALLSAKATGKRIRVVGTGSCGYSQPMETVSYWIYDE